MGFWQRRAVRRQVRALAREYWAEGVPDLHRGETPLTYGHFWALSQAGRAMGTLFVTDWRIVFRYADDDGFLSVATMCPLDRLTTLGRREPGGPGDFVIGVGPVDQGMVLVLEPQNDTAAGHFICEQTYLVLEQARAQATA